MSVSPRAKAAHRARNYQIEMLRESMKKNVIVTMDTGSGKTYVAVLRIQEEFKKPEASGKLVWFLCPNVVLARQQHKVLSEQLFGLSTQIIVGDDGVKHWSSQDVWDSVLLNRHVVVSTYQVLLDALQHGFVRIDRLQLLIFDEAHHCAKNDPSKVIMLNHYNPSKNAGKYVPHIMGLTATPIMKTEAKDLIEIENNLNSICCSPRRTRDDLLEHTNFPELIIRTYNNVAPPAHRLCGDAVSALYEQMDMNQDPYVHQLIDEKEIKSSRAYRNAVENRKTFVCEQLRSLTSVIKELEVELGIWASRQFLFLWKSGIKKKIASIGDKLSLRAQELKHLDIMLKSLQVPSLDKGHPHNFDGLSEKVSTLIDVLLDQTNDKNAAGIIFAKMRATVSFLSTLLRTHPRTKDIVKVGSFVGQPKVGEKASTIADDFLPFDSLNVLEDLRSGSKNLIVCTSVAEEGIDISACNFVISFDEPRNLKAFVQRRGRARVGRSKYVVMLPNNEPTIVKKLQFHEDEMKKMYLDDQRKLDKLRILEISETGNRVYEIKETGAKLTLDQAVTHLQHFCSKLPATRFSSRSPNYTYEEVTESTLMCKVELPNSLRPELRNFRSSNKWRSEQMAKKDAAFEAYLALFKAGLVNYNLLPSPADREGEDLFLNIQKGDRLAEVPCQKNPFKILADAWSVSDTFHRYSLDNTQHYGRPEKLLSSEGIGTSMMLGLPLKFQYLQPLTLHWNSQTALSFEMKYHSQGLWSSLGSAESTTGHLLNSVFQSRMTSLDFPQQTWPVLFFPKKEMDNLDIFLTRINSKDLAKRIHNSLKRYEHVDDAEKVEFSVRAIGAIGKPFEYVTVDDREIQMEDELEPTMTQCVVVEKLPARTDFLHEALESNSPIPQYGEYPIDRIVIDPMPVKYAKFSLSIPSIVHHIGRMVLAEDFASRISCLTTRDGKSVLSRIDLILEALTTTSAREPQNYQRLEFLGDAVLGFCAATSLAAGNPMWHQGYLAQGKDGLVNNAFLSRAAEKLRLGEYIMSEAFTGVKWTPLTCHAIHASQQDAKSREMSTKILADIIEALLGATLKESTGFQSKGPTNSPNVLTMLRYLVPSNRWLEHDICLDKLHEFADERVSLPPRFQRLEELIGYHFSRPALLVEALTHPSYQSNREVMNYERLEFLGDSVLEARVTRYLTEHEVELPVGDMHLLRTAAVNNHFLAYLAAQVSVPVTRHELVGWNGEKDKHGGWTYQITENLTLQDFMFHDSSPYFAEEQKKVSERLSRYGPEITQQLESGMQYPWTALASFAPDKWYSDIVESVIAAIYIDSRDEGACEAFLHKLGMWRFLDQAIEKKLVIMQPKQRLGVVTGQKRIKYEQTYKDDQSYKNEQYTCRVYVDEELKGVGCGRRRFESEVYAAANALKTIEDDERGES